MEIPLAIIVLGAVALYGLVFLLVLGKVAGREQDRFRFLSKTRPNDQDWEEIADPLATQRSKIVLLDSPPEEAEKDRDQMVS